MNVTVVLSGWSCSTGTLRAQRMFVGQVPSLQTSAQNASEQYVSYPPTAGHGFEASQYGPHTYVDVSVPETHAEQFVFVPSAVHSEAIPVGHFR
jgi:hypothetical protein